MPIIKYFEPFDWLIGTGEYWDDVVSDIQQEVLARIENITFGEDGYIFAGQWDGLSLVKPAKGRNMMDLIDVNGVKIVQELIKAARSGGGFVSYVMPKFNSNVAYRKLSYATGIPEWKWYVGAGVNVDKIETLIQQKRACPAKKNQKQSFQDPYNSGGDYAVYFYHRQACHQQVKQEFQSIFGIFLKGSH